MKFPRSLLSLLSLCAFLVLSHTASANVVSVSRSETTQQTRSETTQQTRSETTQPMRSETTQQMRSETTQQMRSETTQQTRSETTSSVTSFNQSVDYFFGQTYVNQPRYIRYDITNNKEQYLPFQRTLLFGMEFNARHNCHNGIAPRGRCSVEIRYWPSSEGYHSGQLELRFAEFNEIRFYLSGQAIR